MANKATFINTSAKQQEFIDQHGFSLQMFGTYVLSG